MMHAFCPGHGLRTHGEEITFTAKNQLTPKFLGTAEAYFQISLIYVPWVSVVRGLGDSNPGFQKGFFSGTGL